MTEAAKIITLEEVKKNSTRENLWFVIHDKVYDVTKFMDDHPGGEEVLLEQAGKDATEIFEDVSHSADAKDLMKTYFIGDLPESERKADKKEINEVKQTVKSLNKNLYESDTSLSLTWTQWFITIAVSTCVGLFVRGMLNNSN